MVESPTTINSAYLPWVPSGTRGFSHLHVRRRRAYTEMHRKRDRIKRGKPKIWVKFSACPGPFGPILSSGPCPHLPTQQYLCFFPSPHPAQVVARDTIASHSGCNHHPTPGDHHPAGCNCPPTPVFPDLSPPSATSPQSRLATTSLPFLLRRCHCSSCNSSCVHSTGDAPMPLAAAPQLSSFSPPLLSPHSGHPRISGLPYTNTGAQPPHREGNQFPTPAAPTPRLSPFSYQTGTGSFYYLLKKSQTIAELGCWPFPDLPSISQ